jgi:hypothetical protein
MVHANAITQASGVAALPSSTQVLAKPAGTAAKSSARIVAKSGEMTEQEVPDLEDDGAVADEGEMGDDSAESLERPQGEAKKSKGKETAERPNKKKAGDRAKEPELFHVPPSPGEEKKLWQRPAVISGAVAVLLIVGVGAFFMMGGSKKETKTKAKATTPKKETSAPKPAPTTKPAPPPTPVAVVKREYRSISALRLSSELAANAASANAKYAGVWLEVSGLFQGMEKGAADGPGARPLPSFVSAGVPIRCDLQNSPTEIKRWDGLRPGNPLTVRAQYSKDGLLQTCELLYQVNASADGLYKGKEVELAGYVERVTFSSDPGTFPTVQLERDTNSLITSIDCLFRKKDEDEVKKIQTGTHLIIRGTCGGRRVTGAGTSILRLDNCQIVYTSAPEPPAVRLDVSQFLREYEEDMRPMLLPEPGKEQAVSGVQTVTQLAEELEASPPVSQQTFVVKYLNKVISVSSKIMTKTPPNLVVLESEGTDKHLKIQCYFRKQDFRELNHLADYSIRGWCSGFAAPGVLRLDNCQGFDPRGGKDPRLTADYLPAEPGQRWIYDLAVHEAHKRGKMDISRQLMVVKPNGDIEGLTTHTGQIPDKSLFDEEDPDRWLSLTKVRKVSLPGVHFSRRISAGFVEIGQWVVGKDGKREVGWEPILKLGARTGDTWSWTQPDADHLFTLVKFDQYRGRPCALIQEAVAMAVGPYRHLEIRHVFVKGVGEVELQRVAVQAQEKVLLTERRLVEPSAPRAPVDGKDNKPATPAANPETKRPSGTKS